MFFLFGYWMVRANEKCVVLVYELKIENNVSVRCWSCSQCGLADKLMFFFFYEKCEKILKTAVVEFIEYKNY